MIFHTLPTPPALAPFVYRLWLCDDYVPGHVLERILPHGMMALVINLAGEPLRIYEGDRAARRRDLGIASFCGAQSASFVIDTAQQRSIMGVHFAPGGAYPFLGRPADDTRDEHPSLADIWGRAEADHLVADLYDAPTPEARLRALAGALAARLPRAKPRHPAVGYALREYRAAPFGVTVSRLIDRTGLSHRRFSGLFRRETGFTPKLYGRIRRFQGAIQRLAPMRDPDWARFALDCGYCDQAHFINDFRALSGLTPSTYMRQRGPDLNHVPMTS